MSKENPSDILAALLAFQQSQTLLIQYENTKDSSLLPKIKSVKVDCQRAIDTWISKLHSIDNADPVRPILLMALSMVYRMLGGAHMYQPAVKACMVYLASRTGRVIRNVGRRNQNEMAVSTVGRLCETLTDIL